MVGSKSTSHSSMTSKLGLRSVSGDRHARGGEGMQAAREELREHDARVGGATAETKLTIEAGAWARWVPDVDTEFLRCGY
jgi:hypothetical protein